MPQPSASLGLELCSYMSVQCVQMYLVALDSTKQACMPAQPLTLIP